MWVISKTYSFSASHELRDMPEGHPCKRNHGHNYEVEIALVGYELDDKSMVADYGLIDAAGKWIEEQYDHRLLNDVIGISPIDRQPTAEALATTIAAKILTEEEWEKWSHLLYSVTVKETPKTSATFVIPRVDAESDNDS